MKQVLILALLFISLILFIGFRIKPKTSPSGTYKLNTNKFIKGREPDLRYGIIQIKELPRSKAAITLESSLGPPSYNSGSFVDTLVITNNTITYTTPEYDSSCILTLKFLPKGIIVMQKSANPNSACGFGHGVDASGFYKRISNDTPILKQPITGEIISPN